MLAWYTILKVCLKVEDVFVTAVVYILALLSSPVADKPVHLMLTAGFGFRQRPGCKATTPSKGRHSSKLLEATGRLVARTVTFCNLATGS